MLLQSLCGLRCYSRLSTLPPVTRGDGGSEVTDKGKSYLLGHITKNAVLCRQVLGGSTLRGPVFFALHVIVIDTPLMRLKLICFIYHKKSCVMLIARYWDGV